MELRIYDKEKNLHHYKDVLTEKKTEFGKTYICEEYVLYEFQSKFKHLFNQFCNNLEQFSSYKLNEFSKNFPVDYSYYENDLGDFIIKIQKKSDFLNLEDVLIYGMEVEEIPERQKIWIINRLFNIICFLGIKHISHNDIRTTNCYVSFKTHDCCLIGGWHFQTKMDEKIQFCTKEIWSLLPEFYQKIKTATPKIDTLSVIEIGKKLFQECEHKEFHDFFYNFHYKHRIDIYSEWENLVGSIYKKEFSYWELENEYLY